MDFALTPKAAELEQRSHVFADEVLASRARSADELAEFEPAIARELGDAGLLDERFGALELAVIYEQLGRVDSSVRGFATVQVSLVASCIADWGSQAQREAWLAKLRGGIAIGCYALSEPDAGSDIRSIRTLATRDDGGWRLNGEKHWITNGDVAQVAIVFADTDAGVTAFLVPTSTPGFVVEAMPGQDLGHRASSHARIRLEDVSVADQARLGEPGKGFAVATSALNHGRLGVAAGATGVLQACVDATVDFARKRRQFGSRIGDFEMVQAAIADMAVDLEAARLLVRQAAWLSDSNKDNRFAVAAAKLFCTEAALRAADQAILLHGARGYSTAYPVERYWRDAKGMQIYEGTSHIQRIIIARHLLGREVETTA